MPRFGTPNAFLCVCLIDFRAVSSLKEPNFETAVLYCIKCSKLYYDSCSNQIVCCNLFRAYQRNREVMTRNSQDHHFKVLLTNNYIRQNLRVRSMAVVMYNFVGYWGGFKFRGPIEFLCIFYTFLGVYDSNAFVSEAWVEPVTPLNTPIRLWLEVFIDSFTNLCSAHSRDLLRGVPSPATTI